MGFRLFQRTSFCEESRQPDSVDVRFPLDWTVWVFYSERLALVGMFPDATVQPFLQSFVGLSFELEFLSQLHLQTNRVVVGLQQLPHLVLE